MISFSAAVKNGFKKAFDFRGCATRAEYWWWQLFRVVLNLPLALLYAYFCSTSENEFYSFIVLAVVVLIDLILYIPDFSLLVRRLRDVGQSWTVILWSYVPVLGIIFNIQILIATLMEGDVYNYPHEKSEE